MVTYATSLDGPFVFDDFATVVQNPRLADGVAAAVSTPAETPVAGRPLAHVSLALNYALGGLNPAGYHYLNLAVHIGCALILFGFLKLALQSSDLAFAAALLWTVHPLNSEVVNYVTQRTESLMALGYFLTMYAAARAVGDKRLRWQIAAVVACLAGALSKESIATAPLMVMLYDRVFVYSSFRDAWRARARLYAGLAASWIVLAVTLARNGQTVAAGFTSAGVSPRTYLLNQAEMVAHYLHLAVWPGPLVVYYGWPVAVTLADVWLPALFICLLLLATAALLRYAPRYGFWAAWVFIALAPTSTVIPIATEVGAERRMYVALAGLMTLAVIAAFRLLPRRTPLAIAMALVATALSARTIARNAEYDSALTLAQTVLDRWPTPNAHQLVGTELARLGRHAEAIPHLRQAASGYPPAGYFLGVSLLAAGQRDDAMVALERFIAAEPNALAARAAHGLLAEAMAESGAFDKAVPHYQAYLEARPQDAPGWNALGIALARAGRGAEAVTAFSRAAAVAPRSVEFRLNVARALADQGRRDEAIAWARQALTIEPANSAAADLLRSLMQGR